MTDIIGGIEVLRERMVREDPRVSDALGELRSNLEAQIRERYAVNNPQQPSEPLPNRHHAMQSTAVGTEEPEPGRISQQASEYDRHAGVVPQVNYARRLFNKYWHPADYFRREVTSAGDGYEQEVVLTVLVLIGTLIVLFYFFSATANELLND